MTEEINKGCEFQSDCIEYKDISYLKIMPICAIYELSIACHHKVDKCKYYKLYEQLKRLEQENKELKSQRDEARIAYNNLILDIVSDIPFEGEIGGERFISIKDRLHQMQKALASLEEIRTYLDTLSSIDSDFTNTETYLRIQDKINEVLGDEV